MLKVLNICKSKKEEIKERYRHKNRVRKAKPYKGIISVVCPTIPRFFDLHQYYNTGIFLTCIREALSIISVLENINFILSFKILCFCKQKLPYLTGYINTR